MRLYCVRYGATLVILGGGGYKNVRSLQDNPKLKTENKITRKISKTIQEAMNLGEIEFTSDYYDFKGNFELNTEDYE